MEAVRKKFNAPEFKDELSIVSAARKGVRPAVFYNLASAAKLPEKKLAAILHLHPRTISNYKSRRQSLNPVESEHLLKLIVLFSKGEELFENIDEFNSWLQKPHWNTAETPMDWLNTPGGVDLIIDELGRLAHGYVA